MVATKKPPPALEITTPSDLEIQMTRVFDAPARLLWQASTTPAYVKRWWGGACMNLHTCEIDLRVGGSWRYVSGGPDGKDHGFHGVYRELVPSERIVHTQVYEPYPDVEAIVTVTFVEHDDKTTLTSTIRHQTKANRDGHLASGMEKGIAESYDELEQVAASLRG
jgi:uncharacterized protein YndB with AHSA1/START domain